MSKVNFLNQADQLSGNYISHLYGYAHKKIWKWRNFIKWVMKRKIQNMILTRLKQGLLKEAEIVWK